MDINDPQKIANDLKEGMPSISMSSMRLTVASDVVKWAQSCVGYIINNGPVSTKTFVVDGYNDYGLRDSDDEPNGTLNDYLLAN